MANTDNDEWEYEYNENELEDFYIPIDLGNVPNAQGSINSLPKVGHPTLLRSKLRALNAERREAETPSIVPNTEDSVPMGEIQIIGLHTSNPLLMYNGQLLSCQWTSTIGSDLLFAKPEFDSSDLNPPLRSLPSVDLLATSCAKLVARVGRLRPRDSLFDNISGERQDTESIEVPQENYNATEATQTEARDSRPPPSDFLTRLNAAKAKRGEKSRLTASNTPNGFRLVAKEIEKEPSAENAGDEDTVMSGT